MNLITLVKTPPSPDPTELWLASHEKLNWQPWNLHNAINAAFAKAVWLGISAPYAVEVVQELCAKNHQPLNPDNLWVAWFECVRQLNGYPDEAELDVA